MGHECTASLADAGGSHHPVATQENREVIWRADRVRELQEFLLGAGVMTAVATLCASGPGRRGVYIGREEQEKAHGKQGRLTGLVHSSASELSSDSPSVGCEMTVGGARVGVAKPIRWLAGWYVEAEIVCWRLGCRGLILQQLLLYYI